MDRRTTLPLILAVLILLPTVSAQGSCSVVTAPDKIFSMILQAVYESNGYFPFQTLKLYPTEKKPVERNVLVLADPSSGTAYDVTVSDTAVPPSETILGNVYSEGPFVVSLLIDDTLRFAYPNGYGDGPFLKERFEGRYEYGLSQEALSTIIRTTLYATVATFTPISGIKSVLEKHAPIKNRILSNSFDITIACASASCQRELYSLLTKYLNIGASAEMVFEMGASLTGGIISQLVPSKGQETESVLAKFVPKRVKERFEDFKEALTNFGDKLRELKLGYYKASQIAYDRLPDTEKEVIKKMLEKPSEADILIKKLSPKGRRVAYTFFKDFGDIAKELEKGELTKAELESIAERLKFYSTITGDDMFKKAASTAEEILKKCKKPDDTCELVTTTEQGERVEIFRNLVVKRVLKEEGGEVREEVVRKDVIKELQGLSNTSERLAPHVPFLASQFDYINQGLRNALGIESEAGLKSSLKGSFVRYAGIPLAFYILRAGPVFFSNPIFSPDVKGTLLNIFPIRQAYKLPEEWRFIELKPLQDRDAVVDVLVGHGSDPGDLFQSVLSLSGVGALNSIIEHLTGRPLLEPFIVTKEKERLYHMKDAIVTVAVPNTCENCHLEESDTGVSFTTNASTFVALTENSSPKEGSTLITFFRKTNMYENGKKVLDMTDKENACINKCRILKGLPGLGILKDPVEGMFATSLFIGYIVPMVLEIGSLGSVFLAYPFIASATYQGCFTCTDTTFGYYLHERALTTEGVSPEANIVGSVTSSLKALGIDVNNLQFLKNYKKSQVEKHQVMLYARMPSAKGVLFGDVVAQWAKTEKALPTGPRNAKLVLVGEKNVVLDGDTMEENGDKVSSVAVSLAVPDTKIPGFIIPKKLILIIPNQSDLLLKAVRSDNYTLSEDVRSCLKKNGITPGILKAIITSKGTIDFNSGSPFVQTENWSGNAGEIDIKGDFKVVIKDATVTFVKEKNEEKMELKKKDIDGGKLRAIIFDNLSLVRVGNALYAWQKVAADVAKEAVAGVSLEPGKNGINMKIIPSENATADERKAIEKMNEVLKNARVLDSSRFTVAIVRGPDGKLYLRIYDKEKNKVIDEEIVGMEQDPNDPTALRITTRDKNGNEHVHTVKVEVTSDGTPVLKVDGKSGGVLKSVQTPDGFLYFDPETGEWKLINGVLAPLAEAFKNGIKMTFEGGIGTGTPGGGIVINTAPQQPGFSLPLLEGWEIVPAILGIVLIFLIK